MVGSKDWWTTSHLPSSYARGGVSTCGERLPWRVWNGWKGVTPPSLDRVCIGIILPSYISYHLCLAWTATYTTDPEPFVLHYVNCPQLIRRCSMVRWVKIWTKKGLLVRIGGEYRWRNLLQICEDTLKTPLFSIRLPGFPTYLIKSMYGLLTYMNDWFLWVSCKWLYQSHGS